MRPPNDVITAQIPRTQLVGLLDSMEPLERQRVTAEVPVQVPVEEETTIPDAQALPPETVVVRFTGRRAVSPVERRRLPSWVIAITTAALLLGLVGLVALAA